MSSALPPPRGPSPLIPLAFVGGFCAAMTGYAVPTARAADLVTGFRIEARACNPTACRPLRASRAPWGGLYACQIRAATVADAVDPRTLARLGRGPWTVRAACVPVHGNPGV